MRGATGLFILIWASVIFQSTRPMRGATCLRHGTIITMMAFQSTRPMRGATNHWKEFNGENTISIHAPHAGRDFRAKPSCLEPLISIHAPHAGRDFAVLLRDFCSPYFNPRAPCGARLIQFPLTGLLRLFQSTRPMRGATLRLRQHGGKPIFQSTRPMRGATAMRTHGMTCGANFNPRAPCGARRWFKTNVIDPVVFQSTRPMRGATADDVLVVCGLLISIHAPHAGRDLRLKHQALADHVPFQSTRPMRGATRSQAVPVSPCFTFQSTRPMRGATRATAAPEPASAYFNPRAPCGARRTSPIRSAPRRLNFNPRAPCGARRHWRPEGGPTPLISIHAPHAGRDQ